MRTFVSEIKEYIYSGVLYLVSSGLIPDIMCRDVSCPDDVIQLTEGRKDVHTRCGTTLKNQIVSRTSQLYKITAV